jgi:hypothetical protein
MAELKTKKNTADVSAFIAAIDNEQTRNDCERLAVMMSEVTGAPPAMWGTSIVGFGTYHYVYATGRTGDWPLCGFSPRKQNLTLYIMNGFDQYESMMKDFGKYKTGKSCLYVKRLDDINQSSLRKLLEASVAFLRKKYPMP